MNRFARAALPAILYFLTIVHAASAATTTIRVNAIDLAQYGCTIDFQAGSGACGDYPSADGGGARARYASHCGAYFQDPLPAGSTVTQIELRVAFFNVGAVTPADRGWAWFGLNLEYGSQAERFIGGVAAPTTEPASYCSPNPSGFEWRSVSGQQDANGIPHYYNGMLNRIHAWGTPTGGDPTQQSSIGPYIEAMEITLHYEPPPRIEFDITDFAPADDRKILISRTHEEPQWDYPSRYQRQLPGTANADRDRKIEITGTVRSSNGQPAANRTIYLRVADPPDPSPYAVNPRAGDNRIWPSGTLRDVGVTTDNFGGFRTVLTGSSIAGDNYRVQASTFPNFNFTSDCNAANNCYQSGELTMWKRVYIEKRKMARNGLFLAQNAPAGADFIVVRGNRYLGNRNNDRLSRNDRIVLLHAPQINRSDALHGWYMEPHTILSVENLGNARYRVELGTRQGNTVIRETLQRPYSVDQEDPRIGDGLTRITGAAITAADVFDASDDLVVGAPGRTSVFRESFLEYVYLPSTGYGADVPMPYLRPESSVADEVLLQALADKWSTIVPASRRTPPNHQLLISPHSRRLRAAIPA